MNNFVIVESPAKAKTIEKFLGNNYTVVASMGHVRDLPESELGVDPKEDFEPRYVVPKDKTKVIAGLKKALKESKADKVYIATDEDREGEAIGWHLLHVLNVKKYERIVFHEITRPAIMAAIENPRKIDQNLVDAQQARRVLDRLVGYKLSPLLWKKIARGLSAGRVQSVAVRLVVDREREIRAFVPTEFWKIVASLEGAGMQFAAELYKVGDRTLKTPNDEKSKAGTFIPNQEESEKIVAAVTKAAHFDVMDVTVRAGTKNPSPPFTTSTLQQEASRKLGFSVKQTMALAQRLYEGMDLGSGRTGLITYMRTDSVNLSKQALEQAKAVITNLYGKEYALGEPRTYKTKAKGAQEAHEAIRPVNLELKPDDVKEFMERNEYRLYDLIWKRTLACQMQEAQIEYTVIQLAPSGQPQYLFQTKGEVIVFPGFIKVYTEGKDEEENVEESSTLPQLKQGETCKILDVKGTQNYTKPEPRYTEASLVKKLESEGIGRPSTYAPTISTIVDRKYVEKREKFLHPTEIGEVVTDFLVEHFSSIVDYKFTARMEEELDEVAEGKMAWQKTIKEFYTPFEKTMKQKEKEIEKFQEKTEEVCEKCGKPMVIKMGRFGKFLSCSDYPECKNIKSIVDKDAGPAPTTEDKCEKCKSNLVMRKGRFGNFWACEKYPECKYTKAILKVTGFKCPDCKEGEVIERKTKKFRTFFGCSRYPDCKFTSWKRPVKLCDCGGLLIEMKKGEAKCLICGKIEDVES